MTYVLSTDRLCLRRWTAADLPPFSKMNQDPAVMQFFPRLLSPTDSAAMVQRINAFFDQTGYGLYAVDIKATGEFIGYTGFANPSFQSFFTPCVEIGWRLKKDAWGQGYATEAARACLQYGFDSLRLEEVYSFTAVINQRSERVMQRIGMVKTGEFDHPNLETGHALRRHVLYRISSGTP